MVRSASPSPCSSRATTSAARSSAAVWMFSVRDPLSTVTSSRAPLASARPTTRVAPAVVRRRTEPGRRRRSATVGCQAVAVAPHRLDGRAVEGQVDLLAQVADVDLDDVRVALELVVPHVVEDLPLRHHLPGPAEQELEDRQLAR